MSWNSLRIGGCFGFALTMGLANAQTLVYRVETDGTPAAKASLDFHARNQAEFVRAEGRVLFYRLKSDLPRTALESLKGAKGVVHVEPVHPVYPQAARRSTSVKEAKAESKRYRTEYRWYWQALNGNDAQPQRYPSVNYLDSYIHFMEERSFPLDSIQWSDYDAAYAQRDQMPAAQIGPSMGETSGAWQFVGPRNLDIPYRTYYGTPPLGGRMNAVEFSPSNADTIYIGGAQAGVWKTTDGGVNWTSLSDSWTHLRVNSIAIDPTNSDTVYVGTGDYNGGLGNGYGIQKSTDGGVSWNVIGASQFSGSSIRRILIDPTSPNTLVVAAGSSNRQLYRSINGGTTFSAVTSGAASWTDLDQGPSSSGSIPTYYAVASGSGGTLLRSSDRGATWTSMTNPIPSGSSSNSLDIAVSKRTPGLVFLLAGGYRKIFRSTDFGASWTDVTAGFVNGSQNYNWSQSSYDFHISMSSSPTQDVVYVGLIDLVQSTDLGATWRSVGGPTYVSSALLHNDQHSFAVNPSNPLQCLVGCDGGVFRLTFNSSYSSWTYAPLNLNLGGTTQFYHASYHPTDSRRMIGGTQDNASPAARGDLQNWSNKGGGDGAFTAISRLNPNVQYTTSQFLNVYRTNNGWSTQSTIGPSYGNDSVAFIAPIAEDPSDASTLYAGTQYLYRWNNATSTWQNRLAGTLLATGTSTIRTIAVAPSNRNYLYSGASDGSLFMSSDFGVSFRSIRTTLPVRNIKDIEVHPTQPNQIWVTLGGSSGVARVWQCLDTNAATPVWIQRNGSGTGTLPDITTSSICVDPANPSQEWYVATDVGVFYTPNGGSSWFNATAPLGLPNVRVDDVTIVPGTSSLYAATHGRGIWRISMAPNSVSSFVGTPNPVYSVNPVTFTVTLGSLAAANGQVVLLSSNQPGVLQVPASVTVPAGQTTITFSGTTQWVSSDQNVTVRAQINGVNTDIAVLVKNLRADINRDGEVGPTDFSLLILAFGSMPGDPNWNPNADLDGDGEVGPTDFALLSNQFGLP